MSALHLLYRDSYAINDSIHISIPTVGQVLDNEDSYYNVVYAITAMPIDFMVQLDDLGIDFTTINAWQLFVLLFENIKQMDKYVLSLVFGDMDLSDFEIGISPQNGKFVIRDEKHDITIDRAIHSQMASVLRKLHHLEKNHRRPANDEAKDYMLRRAREKLKRHKDRKEDSQLESLIIAMVNTEQFKYDFEGTRELSIYQFNESVRQVIKKTDYDNRMYGIYTGTINPKELSQKDLNWLVH